MLLTFDQTKSEAVSIFVNARSSASLKSEVKWPAQHHQAAPSFVRFQTEVGEREPNMADNVAETLDKMNIQESKDVRYI